MRFFEQLFYSFKKYLTRYFILVICIAIAITIVCWFQRNWSNWFSWFEPISTIATLFFAAIIWFTQLNNEWEESLPKKMNIYYLYQDMPIMQCKKANVSSEQDIRQLAQQIASQMLDYIEDYRKKYIGVTRIYKPEEEKNQAATLINTNKQKTNRSPIIHFVAPLIKTDKKRPEKDDNGKYYVPYNIEFLLTKKPAELEGLEGCQIWEPQYICKETKNLRIYTKEVKEDE